MNQVTLHGATVKVGDRVWGVKSGWTTVESINPDHRYKISTGSFSYNQEGKLVGRDKFPSLFWNEQVFDLSKPLSTMEVDAPVRVWDDERSKHIRHFCSFDKDGRIRTFDDGMTSWTAKGCSSVWDNWEPAELSE